METIAVYWESKIRIYGTTIKKGLTLFKVSYPTDCDGYWSSQLKRLSSVVDRFYLLTAQLTGMETLQLSLLVDQNMTDEVRTLFQKAVTEGQASLAIDENVEMIYLHGPHFQDRYGIADAAFSLVEKGGFRLLASGCTGTSVQLVVPAPFAKDVEQCLAETFVVPPPDAG